MTGEEYDVILADPPLKFKVWHNATGSGRSADKHYKTMLADEVTRLDVQKLCARNCALFLWSLWPQMPEAFEIIKSWGFKYKTVAWVWVKTNLISEGYFTGLGYYTRANTEACLLAIRGNLPVAAHDVRALIVSPRRKHSQKPDEQYQKIERL